MIEASKTRKEIGGSSRRKEEKEQKKKERTEPTVFLSRDGFSHRKVPASEL